MVLDILNRLKLSYKDFVKYIVNRVIVWKRSLGFVLVISSLLLMGKGVNNIKCLIK